MPIVKSFDYADNSPLKGRIDDIIDKTFLPPQPKHLLIYYGFPSSYNSRFNANLVIDDISKAYDIWIVGDGYEDPAHPDYSNTIAIISGLKERGVETWGYIPLGVSTQNRPIATLKGQVDDWKVAGVDGIFIDEFGFDFNNTRERQIEIVDYVHSVGLPYAANAFIFEDFGIDNEADLPNWAVDDFRRVSWLAGNPNNLPLERREDTVYLMENWGSDNTGLIDKFGFHERVSLIQASNVNNVRLWGVAVLPEDPEGTMDTAIITDFENPQEVNDYIQTAALIHQIDAAGVNGFSFGAAGNTSLQTVQPELPPLLRGAKVGDRNINLATGVVTRSIGGFTFTVTTDEGAPIYTWGVDGSLDFLSIKDKEALEGIVGGELEAVSGRLDTVEGDITNLQQFDQNVIDGLNLLSLDIEAVEEKLKPTVRIISGNVTAEENEAIFVSTSGVTVTLPLNPSNGDKIIIGVTTDVVDTIVARNGATIMGLSENITLDVPEYATTFLYVASFNDWRII